MTANLSAYLDGCCCSPSCFCAFPPVRRIPSTGQLYSVEELEAAGNVRTFRYLYLPVSA